MNNLTVIIPVNKNENNLDKTLYSLKHQNYNDFDVLVVSNQELDNKEYQAIFPYTFLKKDKGNHSELLNYGVKNVDSENLCFLNSGDMLLYDSIKNRINYLNSNQKFVGGYGLGFDIDANFDVKKNEIYETFYNFKKLPESNLENFLNLSIHPSISSIIVKKEIFEQISFCENYKLNSTWDFFIKLISKHENSIFQLKDPLYLSSETSNLSLNYQSILFRHIREVIDILDDFFENNYISSELELKSYKSIFWNSFFMLEDQAIQSKRIQLYLLLKYLNKQAALKHKDFDILFFITLLNKLFSIR